MFFLISILVVILSCGQTSAVVDKRFPTSRNGDKMTNVVEKDGFLFVTENGILHQLDLGLSSIKSFKTCASDNCNNINKVLAVSGGLLVLCGTGNNGVCQAFEDDEVKYSSSSDSSDSNYLTVSTNINTPAVGIAFEGQFYFGLGMKNEDGRTYGNYITRTHIADNFEITGSAYVSGEEHAIYFRNVFQHNRSIFFLTNQRNNLAPNKMVSKLIRMNVDEPYGANRNLSYSETGLICQAGGDDYSLLQDGAYLPAKGVLVTAFSKGDDPENPLPNSAVCVYNITALSSPISVLKLNNTRITKVKGLDRYGLYPDVFIGTYEGSVIKLSVDNSLQVHVYEPRQTIDRGHPITDIHIGEDKGYVVTNRKISSFGNTDCSIFKTCMEAMSVKNPSCGWCLSKDISTKMSECQQGWISSLSECVSIDVSPKYIALSEIYSSEVTISVKNNPIDLTTNMKCVYYAGEYQVGGFISATRIGDNVFNCTFNGRLEHAEQTLQLVAFDGSDIFTYAETTIQVYDCSFYTTCGSCLPSPEVKCQWCATSLTCQTSSSICPMQVTDRAGCARLETSEIYVPNGITEGITLNVTNLVTAVAYVCSIEQNETRVEVPAIIDRNIVKCHFNVSFAGDHPKMRLSLSVYQVRGQTKVKIENTVQVTVYKCEYLATDCTRCGDLKSNRYDCKWCQSGQCGHTLLCSQTVSCPLPQITEVYPPSGGYIGGTQLQITGTNFGTSTNMISYVRVGDVGCNVYHVLVDNNPDFYHVNKEIQCVLRRSPDKERVGTKNVTFEFDGIRCGYGSYSFLNPVVTKIEPSFGPAIGGTLITLSGTDLDIEGSLPVLTCNTPTVFNPLTVASVRLVWDDERYTSIVTFQFLTNPSITKVSAAKSILSGGTVLRAVGISLNTTTKIVIIAQYAGEQEVAQCMTSLETSLECPFPKAPSTAVKEMIENIQGNGERRSAIDSSIRIDISIMMDGYVKTFEVDYFRDPVVEPLRETIIIPHIGEKRLTITGDYLNLAGRTDDYKVLISDGNCLVIDVTRSKITCIPPEDNPNKTAVNLEVEIQLGNFKQAVGYVKYEAKGVSTDTDNAHYTLGIVLSGVGVVLFIAIIVGVVLFCYKYRRAKARIPKIKMQKRKKSDEQNEMSTSRSQTKPDNHSNAHKVVEGSDYMDLDENRGRPIYQDLDHHGYDNQDVSDYQELDQRQDHDGHVYTGLG